jgi:hypothetical protein
MLDNLRNQASFQPEEPLDFETAKPSKPPRRRRTLNQMTGTTAQQRFILALMLAMIVCLLGTILLLFTGKIAPSFTF